MLYLKALLLLSAVFGGAAATPHPLLSSRDVVSAATLIQGIMPTSNTCAGAKFPDECRTADQAAPYLIVAMEKYGLFTAGEIAGVLSLIGYESVDMKYKHNVYPGRPGQGTSNMQMVNYNKEYAASIPELAPKLAGASNTSILALVTPDQYNFGSGPWFLSTQCTADQRASLATGTDDGFKAYMSCIGVTPADDRMAYWTRAKTAFGLSG